MAENESNYNFREKTILKRLRKIRKEDISIDVKTEIQAKRKPRPKWFKVVRFEYKPRVLEIEQPEIHLDGKVYLGVQDRLIRTEGWQDFEMLLLLKIEQCLLFHVPVTNKFVKRMGELIAKLMCIDTFQATGCWVARMRKKVLQDPVNILNYHLDDEKPWNNTQPSNGRAAMSQCDIFDAIKKEFNSGKIGKYTLFKKRIKQRVWATRKNPASKQYTNKKHENGDQEQNSDDADIDNRLVMDIKVEPETLQEILPPCEEKYPKVAASPDINLPEQMKIADINLPEPNFEMPLDSESSEYILGSALINYPKPSQEKPEIRSTPLIKKQVKLTEIQPKNVPMIYKLRKTKQNPRLKPQKERSVSKSNKNTGTKPKKYGSSKVKASPAPQTTTLHDYFGRSMDNQERCAGNITLNGAAVEKKTTITNAQGETFEITIFEDSFDPSFNDDTSDEMYTEPTDMDLQYQNSATPKPVCTGDEKSLSDILGIPVVIKSEMPSEMVVSEFTSPEKDMLLGL